MRLSAQRLYVPSVSNTPSTGLLPSPLPSPSLPVRPGESFTSQPRSESPFYQESDMPAQWCFVKNYRLTQSALEKWLEKKFGKKDFQLEVRPQLSPPPSAEAPLSLRH